MPSLQQIEKIASQLDSYATYKNLQAQANARYILYGVHEDESNFPLFDKRLTFRTENMAYICLEVACTFYKHGHYEKASIFFDRGATLLEYNYANSQADEQSRGFHLMVCALAYYCANQYSKSFVTISKWEYDGYYAKMIFHFLSRKYQLLENDIKAVLLDDMHEEQEVSPFDILLARAFSLVLNYFYFGDKQSLDYSSEVVKDAAELAILEEDAETWWLFRLLYIVFEGFGISSLWSNLHNHSLFTVDIEEWKDLWMWMGMPEDDWDNNAKDKLVQYIHSLTFRKHPVTELFVSQRIALEKVLQNKSCVVSMPTSSGKTRIAEIVILQSLLRDSNSKVLYIAPFRSLAYEVEETLSNTFNPIGFYVTHLYGGAQITSIDKTEMENARVLIATPEKAKAILRVNDEMLQSIKLIVMDEGHLLAAKPREIANEMFTEELRRVVKVNNGRFLLLSAVLPNADDISRWLSGNNENVISNTWRPSSQRTGLMCYRGDRIDLEWKGEVSCFNSGFVRPNGDKKHAIAEAAIKLSELGSVLIYITRPDWVLSHARAMYELLQDSPDIDWGEDDMDWKRFNLVCQECEEDHEYLLFAQKGILCHSAKLKFDVRRYMERLLRKGKAKYIYATNTLAQGVNLGVSTLIVTNVTLGYGEYLSTNDFWNMAGRTGRSFIDTEGKILFVCDCTRDEKKSRKQAGRYMDIVATERATSGVYTYLHRLCEIQRTTGIDFELFLELITENQYVDLPQFGNIGWAEFFELMDDSLLTLDLAYRDREDDSVKWVDEHFRQSLAVIQEQDEELKKQYLGIIKARVRSVRKTMKGNTMPSAFASSGIPLKAALYLDEKVNELMGMVDEYVDSQCMIEDKVQFFYQFDQIAQNIPSERISVPAEELLNGIRQKWFAGVPMSNDEIKLAESYYGNTVSWLMNALANRFRDEDDERFRNCFDEMSLMAAYGLPSKWAVQIYLCGISSRKVATELSSLVIEPEDITKLSVVARRLRSDSDKLLKKGICSDLTIAWLETLKWKPTNTVREIQKVDSFFFGKDSTEDIPDLLLCKSYDGKTYLCSADLRFYKNVDDTEGLAFSKVADIQGVYFIREGDYWHMKNVNPYVSIVENENEY